MKLLVRELWIFGIKQAYACLFGGYLVALIFITNCWYPLSIPRYDFLFYAAVVFQILLLAFKLETLKEAAVILLFHLVATGMEIFKTSDAIGSWKYPEHFTMGYGNYPFFAGFMYSAVGSYIARVWRIFDFKYSYYPNMVWTILLVILIYINFFTHHYFFDIRWLLYLTSFTLFWRTHIYFKIDQKFRQMPLLVGWLLVALFIWFAENIGTYSKAWIYPNQTSGWHMVSLAKLSSWYLLMLLSFVLVSLINKPALMKSHE